MGNAKHKQQAAQARKQSSLIPILVVLGLVAAAAVATFVVIGGSDEEARRVTDDTRQTQPVVIEGEKLGMFAEGNDSAAGKPAPQVTGKSFDGSEVIVGSKADKPTLIFFFAHWCPHCQKELPLVQDWLSESAPDNVNVLAVSTSVKQGASNFPPSTWFAREDWTTPVLADSVDNEAANAYGLSSFPYYVMVNSDGTVAARLAGERTVDELKTFIAKAK